MTRSITTGVVTIAVVTAVLTAGAVAIGAATDDDADPGSTAADAGGPTARSADGRGDFETEEVRREPCPESRFECVTITVPRDHFAGEADASGDVWEVTYAIQPASGERLGTFVTVTGGPGSAGISVADFYTDAMPAAIPEHYDIVFLNQRGSGPFRPVRCDDAAAAYYREPADVATDAGRDALAVTLQTFVDDCIAEGSIDVADLPFYGTRQAAEDLELVRRHLGADQLTLYGESYGTQFVQTYAAAHPDRVAALLLDGVVDLTVESDQWYDEAARAYDDALVQTLDGCAADEWCAADAGTDDLVAAYDRLAEQLEADPAEVALPLPDGGTADRQLTATDLAIAASGNVGSFGGRMQLLRALNAAFNDNLVPLTRMALQYVYLDPETMEVVPDPSWSDALFYAVECQDYSFYPDAGSPRERLERWLDDHVAGPNDELRLGDVALGDLPCLFWPAQPGTVTRPEPITDPPYPTLVLTSNTDAATPTISALRVFSRLADAHLVTLQDGPHVIFGWGYECVDQLVADFLVDGERPPRVTICDADLFDPYAPLAPDAEGELDQLLDDPAQFVLSVETQLLHHVEYYLWPVTETLEYGCDHGGSATYEPTDVGTEIALDGCEMTDGYPVSGTVTVDDVEGTTTLTLDTPTGTLDALDDGLGLTVTGTWDGEPVDATVSFE